MNLWVGWKWQDCGLQNLADEPLWSVDFATGEIILALLRVTRHITQILRAHDPAAPGRYLE